MPRRRDGETAKDTLAIDDAVDEIPIDDGELPPENIGMINVIDGVAYNSGDLSSSDVLGTLQEHSPKSVTQ